jgi:hypothetical protein
LWYFIEERLQGRKQEEAGGKGQEVKLSTVKGFAGLDFIFNYVRLLATQLRGDTTQLRVDAT